VAYHSNEKASTRFIFSRNNNDSTVSPFPDIEYSVQRKKCQETRLGEVIFAGPEEIVFPQSHE